MRKRPGRILPGSSALWRNTRVRRMLALASGARDLPDRAVAVWGQGAAARRARWLAARRQVPVLTLEDGFLRSLHPGRLGEPPLSILIDRTGVHYDPAHPSDLEDLIERGAGEAAHLRERAAAARRHYVDSDLAKYAAQPRPSAPDPCAPQGHVLVVDQVLGDRSVSASGAGPETFHAMIAAARAEHPGAPIMIKAHPETRLGLRPGHLVSRAGSAALPLAPDDLTSALSGARAVYTCSSLLGYEALLRNVPVRVFGGPFYAGWGLTGDEHRFSRRSARPDLDGLFAVSHLVYPVYYDPFADRLTVFEDTARLLADLAGRRLCSGTAMADRLYGISRWKRRAVVRHLPPNRDRPRFCAGAPPATPRPGTRTLVWAAAASARSDVDAIRIEDGFLRSRGLGAALVPPDSLVFDRTGAHFDPSRPSDLEDLIAIAADEEKQGQAPWAARATALRQRIVRLGLNKYNTSGEIPAPPPSGRAAILVPGQVEDDASIRLGAGPIRSNAALLMQARKANPDAWIAYKPHPDVEAGLRRGNVPDAILANAADVVWSGVSADAALGAVDAVWTMTSLIGFEALLRGVPVICLGMPFYAGWGLTTDLGPACPRRVARPSLDALVHAALIRYPSYVDPVSGLPCPPEVIVDRLSESAVGPAAAPHVRLFRWLKPRVLGRPVPEAPS